MKKEPEATMDDIMVHFTISDIAVRKHIRQLETEGFIQKKKCKQDIGRPFYTYRLTRKGHDLYPNQYKQLPTELLDDLQEIAGKETVNKLFEKRLEREKVVFKEKLNREDYEKQLKKFVTLQNERGYMIELQKADEGNYIMKNFHCPVYHLAENYQQICYYEEKLYKQLFPEKKFHASRQITKGDNVCEWKITARKKDEG